MKPASTIFAALRRALWGLLLVCTFATAAPAPWFRYQSLATGRYLCTQVDPGPHYIRSSGPWLDAGCRR